SQLFKDYVAFPAITAISPGATYRSTLTAKCDGQFAAETSGRMP
ncbi:hypothetical protein L829_4973, partial [Mycobacteroides abscessus MAB_030201_1075]